MIRLLSTEEISELYCCVDSGLIDHIRDSRNYVVPIEDDRYIMAFHTINQNKTVIYADGRRCVIATDDEYVKKCCNGIDRESGLGEMFEFFLALTADDVYSLETLENKISDLEDELLTKGKPDKEGIRRIVGLRKEVLAAKRYYEQMEFLSDELAESSHYFDFVDKKFDRLLEFIMHLQEYIEQVREAYQSQIDIEQNNIMKFFTVITTIFLPLTLITGWFGMNLRMPEFGWKYGYIYAISMSVSVVVIMMIVFKKKKWF